MIPDKFKNTADLSSMADILFRGKMSNNQELNDVAMNIALKVGLAEKTYVKTFGGGFSVSAGEQSNSIIYKIFEKEFYSQGPKSNNSVVSKIQFKPASEEK